MGFTNDVVAGDDALASQYNNMRKDVFNSTGGHNHDGTDTGGRHLADQSVGASKFVMYAGDSVAVDAGVGSPVGMPTSPPVKNKEVLLARGGTYRIKFSLRVTGGVGSGIVRGWIYRNGVEVGTQRSHSSVSGSDSDSATFSEDVAGWNHLDLLQVYVETSGDGSRFGQVIDLQVCSSGIEVSNVIL